MSQLPFDDFKADTCTFTELPFVKYDSPTSSEKKLE